MESIPTPLTMSKLGSCNKGLGALKPQTYKINIKVRGNIIFIITPLVKELVRTNKQWIDLHVEKQHKCVL